MNKIKIYIADVLEVKSGHGKFGKWTLYHVISQDNKKYSTFEGKYVSLKGQEVEVMVEEKEVEKNGQTYKNLTIIEPKKQQANLNDVWFAINDLRDRVEALEKGRGADLGATMREIKKDDISVENLPF